ncbi:MAG: ABC transporter permease, partial [Chloroflexi bacterium]|nr:ABC transporter permease [Chloroflexota bacterium]
MNTFSRRSYRLWQRNRDVFFRVWYSELPGAIAEPLFVLLAMGLGLGGFVGSVNGGSYIQFIAPGIIASYAMFSPTFECTYASYVRMHYQRTYDAIIATPLNVDDVIAGEIFWGTTRAVMTAVVILAVVVAFGLVSSPWALLVPFLAALEGLLFASIAMFYTSLVRSIYTFNYYFTLVVTPMFFFGEVFFPLSSFPPAVQQFAWVVPLTWVSKLMRGLTSGTFYPALWLSL